MIGRGRLFLYRLIFGLVLLVFWELSSGRLIDPFWVSSPSKVFLYLYEVFTDGSIFGHLAITLYETFTGFFIGSIFGIGLGFVLGRKEVLADILDPYVVAFNGIPRIALAPLFIIWFGIGPTSKVILVVSVVFFLTFFNTFGRQECRCGAKKRPAHHGRDGAPGSHENHPADDRAVDRYGVKDQPALCDRRRCRR